MKRLAFIIAISLCVGLVFSGSDLMVSRAYAAETYSFDDTATVVVLHPDSVDAIAQLMIDTRQTTVAVSNFPTSTVGTVSLDADGQNALALLVVAAFLGVGSAGFMVARGVAS